MTAQELQAPCSWTSTTPVTTSADTSTRSPPSAWTAGRMSSMIAVRAARRSPRSSSVRWTAATPVGSGAGPGGLAGRFGVHVVVLPPGRAPGTADPGSRSLHSAVPAPGTVQRAPGRVTWTRRHGRRRVRDRLRPPGAMTPSREGPGVPCGVAPVRTVEPLGPVGLILPTFVQDTVPTWATGPDGTVPDGDPLADLAGLCRRAEQAGADALWACDHLFWHGPCLECLVVLTVAATATERVALGTCVVQLPLRRAVAVAKQAATLQTLSRGRLVLGLGVGSHPGEYEQVGAAYHRRGHDLDTGIGELHRAWASGAGVTRGDTASTSATGRYRQLPAPPPVPVWVGGSSEAAPAPRRPAGRRMDAAVPRGRRLRRRRRTPGQGGRRRRAGPDAVTPAMVLFVSLDDDRARGWPGTAWMGSLYGLPPRRSSGTWWPAPPTRSPPGWPRYRAAGAGARRRLRDRRRAPRPVRAPDDRPPSAGVPTRHQP